jgi:predicted DNA-binding ribbon-helix-helix protein
LTIEARVEPQAKSDGARSASIGTDGGASAPTDGGFADGLTTARSGPIKRSVTIAGHETSISLESLFWEGLNEAAQSLGLPLNALIAQIDAQRIEATKPPNLASAIRVWLYALARNTPSSTVTQLPPM